MLRIDMHSHILPREWPNLHEKYGVAGFPYVLRENDHADIMRDGKFFRRVTENSWNPELRIAQYAEYGIQVQVVSTVPVMFSYWAAPEHTLELARFLNDHIAGICAQYPKNYVGLATLPLQAPGMAIEEMERCYRELSLPGIQIGSHVNKWNLDDANLFPVFEAAADMGAAVFVHPWNMMGSAEMPNYWLPWLVGMPAELSRAICCMIFGGVLERLPNLRVCFAHGGGSFPATIGRIEHGWRMRPDLVAVDNPVNPREYLGKFYVDSVVHDPVALRNLLEVVGKNRVAMGTDYPFPLGEQKPGTVIEALDAPQALQERLFHGTALEWLDLDAARFDQ